MHLGERIRQRRKELGISQPKLADLCGWGSAQGRVSNYEKNLREPTKSDIEIIAINLKTTPEWIMFGRGDKEAAGDVEKAGGLKMIGGVIGYVPLIGWEEVGTFCEVFGKMLKNKENLEKKWRLMPVFVSVGPRCYALQIRDDTMMSPHGSTSFVPGNIAFIDPDQPYKNGDFVVAIVAKGEDAVMKKYAKQADKEYLVSLNTAYPTIEITQNMEIKGKVISNMEFFK